MNVCSYLLNKKRNEINKMEMRLELRITIQGDPEMAPGDSKIVYDS